MYDLVDTAMVWTMVSGVPRALGPIGGAEAAAKDFSFSGRSATAIWASTSR